jgi:squalene-hopene/tetraprenyl-beta-curcumene cyclase
VGSTIEETALAVEALAAGGDAVGRNAARRGVEWLLGAMEAGGLDQPSPIGLYFASLWYFERLYPVIFSVSALGVWARTGD